MAFLNSHSRAKASATVRPQPKGPSSNHWHCWPFLGLLSDPSCPLVGQEQRPELVRLSSLPGQVFPLAARQLRPPHSLTVRCPVEQGLLSATESVHLHWTTAVASHLSPNFPLAPAAIRTAASKHQADPISPLLSPPIPSKIAQSFMDGEPPSPQSP